MPNPIVGLIGAGAATSALGASAQSKAASKASSAQVQAAQLGVDEQRRQFDAVQELLAPFVEGGSDAFKTMGQLAGVYGAEEQAEALDVIEASPQLATAIDMGESAILANAAATGGLRGGNTQAALGELRPSLFSQMIDQRYSQLGGLASMGQASAAQQAAAGQGSANAISNLYGQMGAAQAGAALARGNAVNQGLGGINQALGFGASYMTPPAGAGLFSRWGF